MMWKLGQRGGRVITYGWVQLDTPSRDGWQQGDMLLLMLASLFKTDSHNIADV
jgi:hypothetical protein